MHDRQHQVSLQKHLNLKDVKIIVSADSYITSI